MKVLIVEPERSLLHAIERLLEAHDVSFESFFDPVVALNDCASDCDLAFLDESIPRIKTSKAIQLLKDKNPKIKVAVICNSFIITSDQLLVNQYIDDFITMPFNYASILTPINNLSLFEKEYECFMTFKEKFIIGTIENNAKISQRDMEKLTGLTTEGLREYICVINKKLKQTKINYEEKGFKMVKNND